MPEVTYRQEAPEVIEVNLQEVMKPLKNLDVTNVPGKDRISNWIL